jgi:transcriptional regulator with XRE-family HTH domain
MSEEPGGGRAHPLRRERMLRGWSQQHVADAIEAPDASCVSRWERGVVSPSPHYQERLCRLFGRNAEELGFLGLPAEDDPAPGETAPAAAAPPSAGGAGRSHLRPRTLAVAALLVAAGAAVPLAAGVLHGGRAPSAAPGSIPARNGCDSGWYCFYARPGFGGRRLDFHDCGGRQSLENYGFGQQASSWVNTSGHTVFVYDAAGTLLWKEEPRSASAEVGTGHDDRAAFFETVC